MGITLDQIIALLFNPTVATTVFMLFAGRISEKYRTKAERRLEGQKQAAAGNIVTASSQAVDMMQGMLEIVKREHDHKLDTIKQDLEDVTKDRDKLRIEVEALQRQKKAV